MKKAFLNVVFFVLFVFFTMACNKSDNNEIYSGDFEQNDSDKAISFKINSFEASPSWGDAPLSTSLIWEIENEENLPLICTIDVDGDGNIDFTFNPCPLKGTQPYEFVDAGRYIPVLTVNNASAEIGRASWRARV